MDVDLGKRFATAMLSRDWAGVRNVLDPAVQLRAVTPNRFWVSAPADGVRAGMRFAHVEDPEGNLLELIQPSGT